MEKLADFVGFDELEEKFKEKTENKKINKNCNKKSKGDKKKLT